GALGLGAGVCLLLETGTLKHATPALMARAGLVVIGAGDIGWRPLAERWAARRFPSDAGRRAAALELFDAHFPAVSAAVLAVPMARTSP
ncbi:unnamed protein product, partial [Phaeothamnion confervicola]